MKALNTCFVFVLQSICVKLLYFTANANNIVEWKCFHFPCGLQSIFQKVFLNALKRNKAWMWKLVKFFRAPPTNEFRVYWFFASSHVWHSNRSNRIRTDISTTDQEFHSVFIVDKGKAQKISFRIKHYYNIKMHHYKDAQNHQSIIIFNFWTHKYINRSLGTEQTYYILGLT